MGCIPPLCNFCGSADSLIMASHLVTLIKLMFLIIYIVYSYASSIYSISTANDVFYNIHLQ